MGDDFLRIGEVVDMPGGHAIVTGSTLNDDSRVYDRGVFYGESSRDVNNVVQDLNNGMHNPFGSGPAPTELPGDVLDGVEADELAEIMKRHMKREELSEIEIEILKHHELYNEDFLPVQPQEAPEVDDETGKEERAIDL